MRTLAWILGLGGAAACALTLAWTISLGLYSTQDLVLLNFMLTGVIGAFIASRNPRNTVGWVMIVASLVAVLLLLPLDYGYWALVLHAGTWPLGAIGLWLATWAWSPILGMFLPASLVRFPDGKVPAGWGFVDWLAGIGTALWTISIAIAPAATLRGFLPVGFGDPAAVRAMALLQSPFGSTLSDAALSNLRSDGLALFLLADILAGASLVMRFRRSRGDERLQLTWVAYAGTLMAAAFVWAGIDWTYLGDALGNALLPADFIAFTLPLAIGIAILRYRLYDIDLIINRSIVYLSLTAILGALYTAVLTFWNRFVISATGQKSDAAYVVTAFVVVVAVSPIKDALQRRVDRRLGGARASAALEKFSADVEAVVSVLDVHRIACRLVDEAVSAFGAEGAELYLHRGKDPLYSRGHVNGRGGIEVQLHHGAAQVGRLVVGRRRGDAVYSKHDRDALQQSADSVGEALALASHLGHRPLTGRLEIGSTAALRN